MTFSLHAQRLSRGILGWGVPALVFLLPWGARIIFVEGTVRGQHVESLTLSLFAVTALLFLAAGIVVVGHAPLAGPRPRFALPLMMFLAWTLLSASWAPAPSLALQAAVRVLSAALLFLLVLRVSNLDRVRDAFLASAALQAGLGLWQILSQEVVASTLLGVAAQHPFAASAVIESAAGRMLRAYGTLPHPNVLGGFLAVALVLALADRRQGRAALVISGFVPLLTAGLLASFSRSAWLAAAAGVIALVVVRRHDWRRFALRLSTVVLAVALFAVVAAPFLSARLTAAGRLEQRSLNERYVALEQSRDLLLNRPLVGVGIGMTVPALVAEDAVLLEPPHAAPAVLLVELGLIGFALAVFLALRLLSRGTSLTPEAVALAAAHLPLALLDHYLYTTVPGLLLAAFTLALFVDRSRNMR